ncbi:hypothetical protein LT40_18060 [Pseudomonas rhizosphaerae]|uniref:DUF3077 domain-containing protein n=1 Tax=Pseudomonas rhizosphaerae TaxID=216142 RepID=A0A089ZRD6_9PSED|nr:hypothetical protein LT40_18060 [Pseudomonas rhizosphaerae]
MRKSFEHCSVPVGNYLSDRPALFSVNAGIALQDALAHLGVLLECAQLTANELYDAPDRSLLGVTLHCIEHAQAVVASLRVPQA